MADTHEAQLLSDLLGDIAREDARLDAPHLEARVVAAVTSPAVRLKPDTTYATYVVIAAAIVTAALVSQLFTRNFPQRAVDPEVESIERRVADTPPVVAQSPVPTRSIRPAQPVRASRPTTRTPAARPDASLVEFTPLMPMTEQELAGPFQLVRVQMPSASLGALRSPLEHPHTLIEADVLLGEDGMARAIRVSTTGSVYPWRSR